jgi:hypothetical protein
MAAAWRRPAAWACAAVLLLLSACTYDADEPGLFPTPRPRAESTAVPGGGRFKPQPTNPELPVAGERLWVSGFSQLPITIRIAVHAVRRIDRATVLDWSITPIAAPGFEFGDSLPGTELGLEPATRPSPAMSLLDPAADLAYQPLAHRSRVEFNHCLCVPLLRLQPNLRIGETRLLQTAFPPLLPSLAFVDVNIFTVAPIRHVPVSPVGTAPVARRPTDLARPGELVPAVGDNLDFSNPVKSDQRQRIQVTRVLVAPGRATLEWTLTSLDGQPRNRVLDYQTPVASTPPDGVQLVNFSPASGPVLRVGKTHRSVLWSRTRRNNRTAYECQCTEIGLWAAGLQEPAVTVGLVTNFPALPAGVRTVDVEFPGFGIIRAVPMAEVEDAAANVGPPTPVETGQWTYTTEDPPYGWPTSEWPTDTPDTSELAAYESPVEPLLTLPAAR